MELNLQELEERLQSTEDYFTETTGAHVDNNVRELITLFHNTEQFKYLDYLKVPSLEVTIVE